MGYPTGLTWKSLRVQERVFSYIDFDWDLSSVALHEELLPGLPYPRHILQATSAGQIFRVDFRHANSNIILN